MLKESVCVRERERDRERERERERDVLNKQSKQSFYVTNVSK